MTALRWPANRFFWATIDEPVWRGEGVLPLGLQAAVSEEFPVAIEELHVVGAGLAEEPLVICATNRESLASLDPDVSSLRPEALPECLDLDLSPDRLEILVGDFEPLSTRRARIKHHLMMAVTVSACALLIAIGFARRAAHWEAEAAATRQARVELSDEIAPGVPFGALDAVVERLETVARHAAPRQAGATLSALLEGWPASCASDASFDPRDRLEHQPWCFTGRGGDAVHPGPASAGRVETRRPRSSIPRAG